MCLLAVLHKTHPQVPLIVAANRDEMLERPATAMTVLQEDGPRILGGRDLLAGGTWLAVNEHCVFAALTNRPSSKRESSKRSRGEWPVFLAQHNSAQEAAHRFVEAFPTADFNPGWVFVGDSDQLFYIDMTGPGSGRLEELEPGLYILENRPLESTSAKVQLVRSKLAGIEAYSGDSLIERLTEVLANHDVPPSLGEAGQIPEAPHRPAAAWAACVHLGSYGTRSSTIVEIGAATTPQICSSEGPPCKTQMVDVTHLWNRSTARRTEAHG